MLSGALFLSLLVGLAGAQEPEPEPEPATPPRPADAIILGLSVSPPSGNVSTSFQFLARSTGVEAPQGTLQPNGTRAPIVLYEWDFEGDGEFVEGRRNMRHQYAEDGRYTVTVRVTDATGATGTASRVVTVGEPRTGFQWNVVLDNQSLFLKGAQITLMVSVISILAGLPLGIIVGLMRIAKVAPLRWLAAAYIEPLRGTPVILQIFIVVFALPQLGITLGALVGGTVALTVNTSAYQAEIIRSGIAAIPSGQMEAALGMGMTHVQAMREVILPQALRLVIPPLTNEFIILVKDTSLLSTIGVLEMMGYARVIGNRTFRFFEPLIAVGLMYFVLTYSLSLLLQYTERRLAIPGLGLAGQKGAH
ncbi:MAG TPA: ABC transporter permease subunit [Candidatus Thermoplasmatota archaeon]|nr:ABC transporter permease subunit [Candidatus Thermoplasmatota archaeon]